MPGPAIEKLYYSIGEVADLLDLDAHVLRFWEKEFPELHPKKNRAGRRIYTPEDVGILRRIRHLLRVEKYTIEGARQALGREATEDEAFRERLVELRAFLAKLREGL